METALRLSFEQALEGGKQEVTLPGGERVRITIPKGVRPGTRVRLKGRGQPGPSGQRGDLYVTFLVEPPESLPSWDPIDAGSIRAIALRLRRDGGGVPARSCRQARARSARQVPERQRCR